jgi:hypothetical protein
MIQNVNLWMVQPQENYKLKMTKMDLVRQQEDWIHRMIHQEMIANCHLSSPFSTKIAKNGTLKIFSALCVCVACIVY